MASEEKPRIGVDEWVATHEGRRERGLGLERVPAPALFLAFIVVAAMLPFVTNNGYVLRVGFDTLIYMLLALGLNTVVGFAGLLDLGYVAFFGFGAYIYAMFASSQFGLHWPTPVILIIVVPATILLGLLVGLPSRRLVGDYLAIVTLFFGQLFVTVANNGNRISILGFTHGFNVTNGPNGITNIDPFHLFGHYLESLRSYYWVALLFFLGVFGTIYLVSNSRTGRAWRSLREDSLAAEMMGMPVNRLKLFAFAFGAGVAGLTGTLFASLQTGVYSADFDTPILITIYAMVILGGAGSLGGMILGALVVNVSLEVLRTPNHATWVFFILIIATMLAKLRPWKVLAAVVAGTIAFGFAAYAVITALWPASNDGTGAVSGALGRALEHWVPIPADPTQAGNWGFVALVVLILVLTTLKPFWRNIVLVPTLYLTVFVWDARLAFEPSITRLIMIGVILIVLMNARPQGLIGATRVEATA
jgi:branched-chain amino acid transport system permease protein